LGFRVQEVEEVRKFNRGETDRVREVQMPAAGLVFLSIIFFVFL